jgi:predicted dithiol-disulfide oxidoreductase (DUF899 family)
MAVGFGCQLSELQIQLLGPKQTRGGNTMQATETLQHPVVSEIEWTEAHKAFLSKEKELTHLRDELSRQRRALPWVKVEKNYIFDSSAGKQTLAQLFDGRSQLFVYHFMFGPEWEQGCPSCSMAGDHLDSSRLHVNQRDVSLVAVSRAPLAKIEAFKKRMDWTFPWVSSYDTDFNRDYHVSFTKEEIENQQTYYNFDITRYPAEEAHGGSVFYKNAEGQVFHTYSSYARGLESLLGAYSYLDLAPKGRDEAGLPFPMAWIRHHDRYETGPTIATGSCCSTENH